MNGSETCNFILYQDQKDNNELISFQMKAIIF